MAKIKKSSTYSGSNIKTFDHDVDKIRMRPTQYLGEKGPHMVFSMWREVNDNCVDEHIAGRNNFVHIHFDPDTQRITVIDKGHGIPTEMRKVHGKSISTLTAVFSFLQAGGKFDDKAYKTSRGTHGVGVTATNALSSELQVYSCYKGKPVVQKFVKGHAVGGVTPAKLPTFGSGKYAVKMEKKGTAVSFIPDTSVVGKAKLPIADVIKMCDQTTYMNPKLTILLTIVGKGTKKFQHKGGLTDYLKKIVEKLDCETMGKPCVINTESFDVALQFTDHDSDEAFLGYTNSLPNKDGGVHVDLFRACLYKALLDFAGARAKPFTERDLRDGLIGLIDFKISSPEFSSQTKEKLVDTRVKGVKDDLTKALKKFFDANKSLAKDVITRAGELKALKEEQMTDKRALKSLKTKRGSSGLPSKLAKSSDKFKPHEREIYIVEGDSAGGSAKKARHPHQEILPVKGKVLNVHKSKEGSAFISKVNKKGEEQNEVLLVLRSVGYDPNKKDPCDHLRVGKIILFADPDPDGFHINALQLGLFAKYLKPMFAKGIIYIALTYDYYAKHKGQLYFGNSKEEVRKKCPDTKDIRHVKGWGEIGPDVLGPMAFDEKTRKLVKVQQISGDNYKQFVLIMGEDVAARKKLLNIKG